MSSIKISIRSDDHGSSTEKLFDKIRDVLEKSELVRGEWFEGMDVFELEFHKANEEQKSLLKNHKTIRDILNTNVGIHKARALLEC